MRSILLYFTFIFSACSCGDENKSRCTDIQGHRGARGLYPENTIKGFIEAVKLGVTTLEMDVVISKDSHVVVSHEAWMNDVFCSLPDGSTVPPNSKEKYNIFKMNYDEIALFDCGGRGNEKFPQQKKMIEHKPLLQDVIAAVEVFIQKNNLPPIFYNIETKIEPGNNFEFNPHPKVFVDLVYNEIKKMNVLQRCIIQSFDVRTLKYLHEFDSTITTALLVEDSLSIDNKLMELGFKPSIYSPDFNLLNSAAIIKLHRLNIKVIPWTVNEINDIKKMQALGVDGIISDYPNRAVELLCGESK